MGAGGGQGRRLRRAGGWVLWSEALQWRGRWLGAGSCCAGAGCANVIMLHNWEGWARRVELTAEMVCRLDHGINTALQSRILKSSPRDYESTEVVRKLMFE